MKVVSLLPFTASLIVSMRFVHGATTTSTITSARLPKPTPHPTHPPTPVPSTATPTTATPVTAAPVTAAPVTADPTTAAPTDTPTDSPSQAAPTPAPDVPQVLTVEVYSLGYAPDVCVGQSMPDTVSGAVDLISYLINVDSSNLTLTSGDNYNRLLQGCCGAPEWFCIFMGICHRRALQDATTTTPTVAPSSDLTTATPVTIAPTQGPTDSPTTAPVASPTDAPTTTAPVVTATAAPVTAALTTAPTFAAVVIPVTSVPTSAPSQGDSLGVDLCAKALQLLKQSIVPTITTADCQAAILNAQCRAVVVPP